MVAGRCSNLTPGLTMSRIGRFILSSHVFRANVTVRSLLGRRGVAMLKITAGVATASFLPLLFRPPVAGWRYLQAEPFLHSPVLSHTLQIRLSSPFFSSLDLSRPPPFPWPAPWGWDPGLDCGLASSFRSSRAFASSAEILLSCLNLHSSPRLHPSLW